MARYAMAIDMDRCVGCQACMVACKLENEVPEGYFRLRMRETVTGTFPTLHGEFRLEQCFHCENAPCVRVCPTGATFKNEDGLVLVNPEMCSGCKACVTACPYNMRYAHPNGYIDKCTFCNHRLEEGLEPACVETCPTGARVFGDLEEPGNDVSAAVETAKTWSVLKPETGAEPNLIYLNSRFINTDAEHAKFGISSLFRSPEEES